MKDRHTGRVRNAQYVLVHGAWHGGWCWRDVRTILEAEGHRVLTPTLTGLGDRAHLVSHDIDLNTHIRDVTAVIETEEVTDIILVGHSYGGMVITGVADAMKDSIRHHIRHHIRHCVYLDAAVPDDGQTMISWGPERPAGHVEQARQGLLSLSRDGGLTMDVLSPEMFGVPPSHPSYEWLARHLTPHPFQTWVTPISLKMGGSLGLPRTYMHCVAPILPQTNFPYFADIADKDPSWIYHELQTGHDAMVTAPDIVAGYLNALA